MKRLIMTAFLMLIYSMSSMAIIKSNPEILDFGNIYQGKEYSIGFNLVLTGNDKISFDNIEIMDIIIANNDIKLIRDSGDLQKDDKGPYQFKIEYKAEVILGKLEDKLLVIYKADTDEGLLEKRLEIGVKAYISGFYVISPPSIIIRDLIKTQEREYSLFIETKDRSAFNITQALFSSDNCTDIKIEDINDYRKKLKLYLMYKEEGRFFERLTVNTDNETFSKIEIESLANISGFITLSKRDIAFGRVSRDDDPEDNIILQTLEGLDLEILAINDSGAGLLTFEINQIRNNTISVDVFLYPEMLKRDFFGTINIDAKAGEHRESLKVTYHGTLKK